MILWKTSHSASEGDITVTAPSSIDPARFLHDQLESASPDLLRSMLATFINALMSAEADAVCGAPYGLPGPDRVNVRNGYRHRDFDTRAGTLDVAIPKLRSGSYFPDWLLERRRRAEAALTSVVATCYLLGVSTRRMEKLVESLGITRLSRSQVSEMARDLDEQVEAFRTRPLDAGPYTFVAADALVLKVREGGRVVNVHALLAAGVNADGHREILGLQVTSAEDGATLPGASWQRCRTRYAANLMSVTPKPSWPWVKTMLPSVCDQPDAASVHAQYDRLVDAVAGKLPKVAEHLEHARPDVLAFTSFPKELWRQIWSSNPQERLNGRSAGALTSSGSSRPATPSSASPAPSWPSSTTNGPKAAATSASTSSPAPASPSHPPAPPRR